MSHKILKIGILSDSHQKTELHQEAIEHLLSCGAEYLLHAGDLEREQHLQILENAPVPYVAVYGNNDTALMFFSHKYNIYKEPHYFKIQNIKIKMMHMPYYMNPDADIVISGHTHQFEASVKGETLFINPGEVCAREKPLTECAMVEIELKDKKFQVTHYFRELNKVEWKARNININGD
ncbi:MAG: YfcE family phosphodiesterase [Sulfurovaceae bacterium]|nr:YfcE family phosphodiesterase [Sulfurovaceae bacterium]